MRPSSSVLAASTWPSREVVGPVVRAVVLRVRAAVVAAAGRAPVVRAAVVRAVVLAAGRVAVAAVAVAARVPRVPVRVVVALGRVTAPVTVPFCRVASAHHGQERLWSAYTWELSRAQVTSVMAASARCHSAAEGRREGRVAPTPSARSNNSLKIGRAHV